LKLLVFVPALKRRAIVIRRAAAGEWDDVSPPASKRDAQGCAFGRVTVKGKSQADRQKPSFYWVLRKSFTARTVKFTSRQLKIQRPEI
jgi:hypothetical protein